MSVLTYVDSLSISPTLEPVTVRAVKRNLGVDDGHWDQDIARWVTEARKQVEHDTRVSLVNQTRIHKQDAFPSDNYICLRAPLVSVSTLQYIDTAGSSQTWGSSNYEVDTARHAVWLAWGISWPNIRAIQNAVTITYVSGHGATTATVPEAAKAAIHLFCKMRFDQPTMTVDDYTGVSAYRALIDQLRGGYYP